MKGSLRDLFTFSSGERKGIISLVFILIMICGINMIWMSHQSVPAQMKYPDWMKDSGAFEEADNIIADHSQSESWAGPYPAKAGRDEQKSAIDPNMATMEELILTGFSLRNARTIINYRKKGGKFRTADDLKKIYGVTPEILQSVKPYIIIKDQTQGPKTYIGSVVPVNINTADSAEFEKLNGIGGVLARRIIRYRSVLGGYYSPEQIREVYGISDSLFLLIRERLEADTSDIKKINLNTARESDLAHHPYIGRYFATGIVKYRSHAGKILDIKELIINGLIPEDRYDKLKFYISL
jgi:competence protein ComEA